MERKPSFIGKQIERAAYLFLLSSLVVGRITATLLTRFSFLIPKIGKQKDFLFFPYTHHDNSGTISRYQIYLPFLDKDGYTYHIDYICKKDYYNQIFYKENSRTKEYLLYHRIFWRRLYKTLWARNYRAVFIHRAMFSEYYDQFFPYLERLLHKLNNNITIDYFDAEYARNKLLVDRTVSYCHKVCVVNQHLYNYFSKIHPRVYLNNLAVDTKFYLPKESFKLGRPVTLFWTGSINNTTHLKTIVPVLEKINQEIPLRLIIIGKTNGGYTNAIVEHHEWTSKTFFKYLNESDIAIYPAMIDNEFNRGKVAYKVLDYAAGKIPIVASPFGLTQYFEPEKDVVIAKNEIEWEQQIRRLIGDESLRKQLAENAHKKLMEHHYVIPTYQNLLKILLS